MRFVTDLHAWRRRIRMRPPPRAIASLALRGLRDRSANVALLTAFLLFPLIGIFGLAIDYALAVAAKTKFDLAADAAVISAITTVKSVIDGGGQFAAAQASGQAQAAAAFRANSGSIAFTTAPVPVVTISAPVSQTISASVSYSTTMQNQFGKLFNRSTTTITGSSSSSAVLKSYYQFIFVVDISGSMAVGGTAKDVSGLKADPKIQCAFACHDPYYNRGQDYRFLAKLDGWTLKIDYVNQAITQFMQDLQTQTATIPGYYSVGIDTFATTFNVLLPPTMNLTFAQYVAATIDVEPMMPLYISQGYTRIQTSLASALAAVTNIGDGSSASKQKTYFIFLTDGVEDIEGNQIYGRGAGLNYTTQCQAIKNAGATLISIATPYPVITGENPDQYGILVAPLAPNLTSTINSCASSSSWAYQATDGPGIQLAVQTALANIVKGLARLTQ